MVKISKFSWGFAPWTPSLGVCYRLFYLPRLVILDLLCHSIHTVSYNFNNKCCSYGGALYQPICSTHSALLCYGNYLSISSCSMLSVCCCLQLSIFSLTGSRLIILIPSGQVNMRIENPANLETSLIGGRHTTFTLLSTLVVPELCKL